MRGIQQLVAVYLAVAIVLSSTVSTAGAAGEKPFIAPVKAEIVRDFEPPSHEFGAGHRGIDYGVPPETMVTASGAGTVSFAGQVANDLYVTIEHSGGISTMYSYLSRIDVSSGDPVGQGQVIAHSGHGHPGGPPGLHFGAKLNGKYIDPRLLLSDFDDITDLLELQPAIDGSQAGEGAFRTSPAAAFVGPEIVTGPDDVSGFSQMLPGLDPLPQPNGLRPDGSGPDATDAQFAVVPITPGPPDNVASARGEEAAPGIPTTGRPQDVASWWSGLDENERTRLIAHAPQIGQLEGLPAAVRNAANREALKREIDKLEKDRAATTRELRDLEGKYGSRYLAYGGQQRSAEIKSARERLESLKRRLTNARHLRDSLAQVENRRGDGLALHEVYLLDFDTEFVGDEGRAVVALGNPDTAENVGVVVPGIENRLSNFAGTLGKAANLRETVFRRHGPDVSNKTSTIAWLGYDSPESIFDAIDRGEANAGAKRLKTFVERLRSAQRLVGNWGSSISIFGHSYGSSTSALAVKNGMNVDNLALVGSPGGATHDAKHLVGADRIWAGRFWSDIIRASTGIALLGDDPTNRNFGSIRIPTCCKFLGHGGYFEMGTRSIRNLANILVGEYDAVA
jgi:murein DD-endopeptidase MepM/ murein hydrolase activator NlpD